MHAMRPDTENDAAPASAGGNSAHRQRSRLRRFILPALAVAIFAGAAVWGIQTRLSARSALNASAKDSVRTPVTVAHPRPSNTAAELILPGNVQAYVETPIYARTNGYLKRWYVDIGGRVRAGQLLAEIDAPEVDQELRQAEATQAQAQANLDLARTTAERWQNLLKSDGVSQQEVDQNAAAYKARGADLRAAAANVQRLKDLQSFKEVRAPFSGVVTARNVDVGALIANGNSQQLFRLAQTNTLRVYVNVPQVYSRSIVSGLAADLQIPEFPHRIFSGKVIRSSGAIDPASRTLLTEVQVPNPSGALLPGAYAMVRFHLALVDPPLVVPSSALLFRSQGAQVAVVESQGTIHLRSVTLGRDLSTSMEILSGLSASDSIVLNPPDSIADGDPVVVTQTQDFPPAATEKSPQNR